MYHIIIKGRTYRYATFDAANAAANAIFNKTGVIVGIYHHP